MEEQIRWDEIKADYMTGEYTVKQLAEKYGTNPQRIYRRASNEAWQKTRDKIAVKAEERYVARASRARAKELETVTRAAGRLSDLLESTVEAMNELPSEAVIKNLKGLSAMASAIYTNVEALTKLHGIQTPAQVEAQKIARQRVRIEQRRLQLEEKKSTQRDEGAKLRYELVIDRSEGEVGAMDE